MTDSTSRSIVYFTEKGPANTAELAAIVAKRVEAGDITAVVVATTSGQTALTLAEALPAGTRVYGVNFQNSDRLDPEIHAQAEAAGVVFMPDEPVAKYIREVDGHSPDSLRCFGQGMKVAVEVVMMAVEVGHIQASDQVIGIGGSSRGADVAIVATASGPEDLSRLWVSEILAKPL